MPGQVGVGMVALQAALRYVPMVMLVPSGQILPRKFARKDASPIVDETDIVLEHVRDRVHNDGLRKQRHQLRSEL